ncbi:hypothetical protein EV700_0419 [Fluviicoccus keumensis]|uniref:Lipoprotein n=1 Tax=Fluviicoccus keumensis TaxID=1435465 RepID=A0A4Q7ZA63_9GAMM|nr:hypothetical protein [Fluviicoccus keumensis]RZU47457.1 hypothetical protein EV700_0419 [Fluviicoccus keumensis]
MIRGRLAAACLALAGLAGCASNGPYPQTQAAYHAPGGAYSFNLSSQALQGKLELTEQCEPYGGSLNIWDSKNRFFRIDYLNLIAHPVVRPPSFANDRTLNDMVLSYYLSDVLDKEKTILERKVLFKDTVNSDVGEGLLAIVSMTMKPESLPKDALDNTIYYGFFVVRRGDFSYIVQHRQEVYQPERMKAMLVTLVTDMTIPGKGYEQRKVDGLGVVDQVFGSQTEIDAWKKAQNCI